MRHIPGIISAIVLSVALSTTPAHADVQEAIDHVMQLVAGGEPLPPPAETIAYDPDGEAFNNQLYASMAADIAKISVTLEPGRTQDSLGTNADVWISAIRDRRGEIYQCRLDPNQGWLGALVGFVVRVAPSAWREYRERFSLPSRYYVALYIEPDGNTVRRVDFLRRRESAPRQPRPDNCTQS